MFDVCKVACLVVGEPILWDFFTNFLSIFFIIKPTKEKSEHILKVLFLRPCDESKSLKVINFQRIFFVFANTQRRPFWLWAGWTAAVARVEEWMIHSPRSESWLIFTGCCCSHHHQSPESSWEFLENCVPQAQALWVSPSMKRIRI